MKILIDFRYTWLTLLEVQALKVFIIMVKLAEIKHLECLIMDQFKKIKRNMEEISLQKFS